LAQKPTVLLLDDCLSAVDSYTEKVILENLDRELKSATLIWVAHRETTLQKCTRIINLDEQ
jgi:ATP-binding cassette subfamily B protein